MIRVQLLDQFRADQKLKPDIKDAFQMPQMMTGLGHQLQEACSRSDYPLGKELLPNVQSKAPLVQL